MKRSIHERGDVTLWFVTLTAALILLLGLAYDGSVKIQAVREAQAIAADAVRTAGQQIDVTSVMSGAPASVAPFQAQQAGQQIITANGASGTLSVVGSQITADVSVTHPTVFLGLIGITEVTGHGSATANAYQGIGGI